MKKSLLAVALIIFALVVIVSWSKDEPSIATNSEPVTQSSTRPTQENAHIHEYAAKGRVPAYYTTTPDVVTLPPTLAPELFTGNQKLAYQAAKAVPQTLAQLPCYCHCDRSSNHKSLHSCFESDHGENRGICIGEALMAHRLQKRGVAVPEIRKQIIAAYGDK